MKQAITLTVLAIVAGLIAVTIEHLNAAALEREPSAPLEAFE